LFFIKFFQFLKGYVILNLTGDNKETKLDKIRKSGAVLKDISYEEDRIQLMLSYEEFLLIKDRKDDIGFVEERAVGGIFFVRKIKSHAVLLAGLVLIVVSVMAGSNFIWTVEYEGVSPEKLEEVIAAANLAGIKTGALKNRLMTPLELKNTILANTHDIAWCWVYINGTRAVVEVRENLIPPQIFDPDLPCDIVAAKDGIVKKIITKRGKCVVEDNTFVSCGDLLISGRVTFGENEGYPVHSSGDCQAVTHYEREGVYKLYRNHKIYTGKKRSFLTLKLFAWQIPLYFKDSTDFPYWDKNENVYEISLGKDNYIGIGLEKVSFFEYNIEKEPISPESCAEFAKMELEEEIAKELLPGAVLLSSDASVEVVDNETISVKLVMEFTEQIAAEKYIEEVTFIEPKTD